MNKLLISSMITIALGLSACGTTQLKNADGESVQDIQSKLLGDQKAGWTLVSSTKSKNSILVFIKKDRTATIEIEEGGFGGKANVMLTVAPRSTVIPPVTK